MVCTSTAVGEAALGILTAGEDNLKREETIIHKNCGIDEKHTRRVSKRKIMTL
jgi:hypothetical protein